MSAHDLRSAATTPDPSPVSGSAVRAAIARRSVRSALVERQRNEVKTMRSKRELAKLPFDEEEDRKTVRLEERRQRREILAERLNGCEEIARARCLAMELESLATCLVPTWLFLRFLQRFSDIEIDAAALRSNESITRGGLILEQRAAWNALSRQFALGPNEEDAANSRYQRAVEEREINRRMAERAEQDLKRQREQRRRQAERDREQQAKNRTIIETRRVFAKSQAELVSDEEPRERRILAKLLWSMREAVFEERLEELENTVRLCLFRDQCEKAEDLHRIGLELAQVLEVQSLAQSMERDLAQLKVDQENEERSAAENQKHSEEMEQLRREQRRRYRTLSLESSESPFTREQHLKCQTETLRKVVADTAIAPSSPLRNVPKNRPPSAAEQRLSEARRRLKERQCAIREDVDM